MNFLIKTIARTAPLIYPDAGSGAAFSRMKYCARCLAQAHCSKEWFNLLHRPELASVGKYHPYVFCKLQRPYLHRKLNVRQRLDILKQHYHFVATRFSKSVMEAVYASPGLLLATIRLEEVGNFGVRLSYGRQEKEGDLLISLINLESAQVLFELSFCISRFDAQGSELFIGGVQGNRQTHDKDLVIAITRAMYGLRPKALLVFVLQQLAACWGIARLRAVSDDTHIYRHPHKIRDLAASYDELWTESGGTLAGDGMFDLPATFVPRDISTLKPNKRQMYRRRYVLMAEIAEQIKDSWCRPRNKGVKP